MKRDHDAATKALDGSGTVSKLVFYMLAERMQAIGWMYAEACNLADQRIDIRTVEVPEILDHMHRDLDRPLSEEELERL